MGWGYSFLLVSVLALGSYVNAATTEVGAGCIFGPEAVSDSYFNVIGYRATGNYQDSYYVANGYTSYSESAVSRTGIYDINTRWYNPEAFSYALQFTGYFLAPETGLYIVSVYIEPQYDQESVMVWLGSDMAFGCCQQQIPPESADGSLLFVNSLTAYESYVLLEEDIYYPMRIVMVAELNYAQFLLSMETPSENVINNVAGYVVQMYGFAEECAPVTAASTTSEYTAATLYWTGLNTFTSTYVFTTTDSSSNVHVVTESAEVVPAPPVFTTDVSFTTTVVTEYTAVDTTLGATPYVTVGNQ